MQQIPVLKILLLAMAGFFLPALLLKMWFTLCHPAFFPRFSLLQKGLLQQKKGSRVYGFIDTAGQWVISGIAFLGKNHLNILEVLLAGYCRKAERAGLPRQAMLCIVRLRYLSQANSSCSGYLLQNQYNCSYYYPCFRG